MAKRPIVLIHGYSDKGESFGNWARIFRQNGYSADEVRIVTYRSLVNEISVKDIAEGFEKVLQQQAGLQDNQPFDAVVHSTGMLVLRAWLARYAKRNLGRVKHMIGLAPATFGSPLAHKGKSWLGAIFKGNRELGPDFLDTGQRVLSALELGSSFTWDLAHQDLLGDKPFYGPKSNTPWVFTFCGTEGYGGLRRVIHEPGSDGTVRLAGCALNTQKVTLDLSGEGDDANPQSRISWSGFRNVECPLWPVPGLNHGTIISEPTPQLVSLVMSALEVESLQAYEGWGTAARKQTQPQTLKQQWQQFVIRARDERGEGIPDFHVELAMRTSRGRETILQDVKYVKLDVHPYSEDPSYRCFHLDISQLSRFEGQPLSVRFMADSGTRYATYRGLNAEAASAAKLQGDRPWQACVDVPTVASPGEPTFFFPFTTTLVELVLNREVNLPGHEPVIYPIEA